MKDWILAVGAAVGALVYLYADYRMPRLELGDPLGPRAFPALIGILLLISAVMLALGTRRRQPVIEVSARPARASHYPVLAGMVVWTCCYYTVFESVGYITATIVYLFGLLCFFNRGRHVMNVSVAVGFTVVAHAVFSRLLTVQLPAGPLGF